MVQHNFCAKFSADFLWLFHKLHEHRMFKTCLAFVVIEGAFNALALTVSETATKPASLWNILMGSSNGLEKSTDFSIDLLAINIIAGIMCLAIISLAAISILVIHAWLLVKQDSIHCIKDYRVNVRDAYEQKKLSKRS